MAKDSGILQVAVVGTNFGCLAHVRALKAAGFEVRALVGRDAERTRARAQAFGVAEALTSYEQALALPGLDAVVIATPPQTHKPLALAALAQHKHVLCEKPLALSAAEAREMLDAAGRAGVVHMVQHQFRFRPQDIALHRVIQEGTLGTLRQASFLLDGTLCADPDNMGIPQWWRESGTGGGWLRNYASHQIDLIRYTLGEFDSVSAGLTIGSDRNMNADDGYSVVFRLCNGLEGIMQGTCRAWEFAHVSRLTGSAATASIEMDPKAFQFQLWITDRNGKRPVSMSENFVVPPPQEMLPISAETSVYDAVHNVVSGSSEYHMQALAFRQAIEGNDAGPVTPATFKDGLAHMLVIEAIEKAARQHEWVRVLQADQR